MKSYTAIVEKCGESGLYIGCVPGFPGAHSRGESLDEPREDLLDSRWNATFPTIPVAGSS